MQSEDWSLPDGWDINVLNNWEIAHLLTDLEAATSKRYRQNTRKDLLLGLLCGYDYQKISKDLHKNNGSVRTEVCNIYRDIETLTGMPAKSVRASNLVSILEQNGYRKSTARANNHRILHNLPAPTYTEFIGRDDEMRRLLQLLSPDHAAHIIMIDGIGGVGKTALVLAAAYLCLEASHQNLPTPLKFDAIIFTSAKPQYLDPNGIVPRSQAQRNLRDIFREIAYALDDQTITQSAPHDQFDRVRQSLSKQRTLLIVDNIETMQDTEDLKAFLYDLPVCVKVVITSRERFTFLPIRLWHLPLDDGLRLIQQQAEEKGLILNNGDSKLLYDSTGGVPLAIVYAIGQVSSGYSLKFVLGRLPLANGDVARFCFEQSVQKMKGQPPHKLLMSLAIFPDSPILAAVANIAGFTADPDSTNDGLARLQQLSFVNLNQETGRYEMLSLTREYALAELAAHPDFEKEARKRWVKWYLDFAQSYAGEDWSKWIHDNKLRQEEGNLRAVLYWCKNQNDYEQVRDLWLLLNHYANLYAYWLDRLYWLEWLIEQSERRGEWSSLVKITIRKSWLLIRECSNQSLKEADEILRRIWVLRDHADLCDRADLAESVVRLRIRQRNYEDARHWLTVEEKLVNEANLEERQHIRYFIPVLYHHAEILYQEDQYVQANEIFQDVVEKAKRISWHRVINSAQNWLADIAIKLGDRDEAEKLLIKGLTVAQSSKNKRRLARYQRSHAYWELNWGTTEAVLKYATQAMNGFNDLGMIREAQEMRSFLDSL